ncbi:MAG: hypothetical protein M3373_00115 [Gemmatimonadota bacterium]|nr:hypothetical protein [Gemmatimonadota bacterium]
MATLPIRSRLRLSAAIIVVAAVAACAEPASGPAGPLLPSQSVGIAASLVTCPTTAGMSTSATIGEEGGTVVNGRHSMTLPSGAVSNPTLFTIEVPPSSFMEVSITANGGDHFQFLAPVIVRLDYARCPAGQVDRAPLRVLYIDADTKAFLADMRGRDRKDQRRIIFETDHLSSYAVAH